MKCTYRFEMIVRLLLLVTALAIAESPAAVVALKRDAGLTTAGAIDSRFTVGLTSDADATAPAAVVNLATSNPTSNSITLTWTAPGDDGTTGTATSYDIRYRTVSAVDDQNWATATQVTGEPTPTVGRHQSDHDRQRPIGRHHLLLRHEDVRRGAQLLGPVQPQPQRHDHLSARHHGPGRDRRLPRHDGGLWLPQLRARGRVPPHCS